MFRFIHVPQAPPLPPFTLDSPACLLFVAEIWVCNVNEWKWDGPRMSDGISAPFFAPCKAASKSARKNLCFVCCETERATLFFSNFNLQTGQSHSQLPRPPADKFICMYLWIDGFVEERTDLVLRAVASPLFRGITKNTKFVKIKRVFYKLLCNRQTENKE